MRDFHNSVIHYFQTNQFILQSYLWVNMNSMSTLDLWIFIYQSKKLTDMISRFYIPITTSVETSLCVEFCVVSKKISHNYMKYSFVF